MIPPQARSAAVALGGALCVAAAGGAVSGSVAAQDPTTQQVFPGKVDQVTVDVVVVDKRGQPVEGLVREDFTVLEEGRPQNVVSFDVIQGPTVAAGPRPAGEVALGRPRVVTNLEPPRERGRLFVVAFDDIHMSPLNAQRAKAAVAEFLRRGCRDGDRVTLLATSGEAWWSTLLPAGRDDLTAVLKRLDGRRVHENAQERMTDHEAVRIFAFRDVLVAARVLARWDRYGTVSRQGLQASQQEQAMRGGVPTQIDPYVEMRASEAYFKFRSRLEVTSGVLERSLEALAESRVRKSVLLVSEGFAYDLSFEPIKRVKEAARRANAAVYFVDTRGLGSLSNVYSAEFGNPLPEQDLMAAIADVSLEGEGAVALASDTGGFSVRNTNDLAAGIVRIGRESESYYLLGYNPGPIPRDGRFRSIEVRVRGKGLTVRARRGYYAPSDGAPAAAKPDARDPELQHALDSPGAIDGLPLRMGAFALQDAEPGKARVTFAADVDVSRLRFPEKDGRAVATLDTLLVVAHRESGEFQRSDQLVELARQGGPGSGPVWYSFLREFDLPAGAYQAKLVVRDAATKHVGSVMLELDVPALDRLRVSTPILTDRIERTAEGGAVPTLVLRRSFPGDGLLYCRFDVFGAARGPDGRPQVRAGYELRRGGAVVASAPQTTIQPTSIGSLIRFLQIPLAATPPGDYELVLAIRDEITGESRELVEPFSVEAGARASR
jgi:VWFA-related protein